jgi:hypothetical protein
MSNPYNILSEAEKLGRWWNRSGDRDFQDHSEALTAAVELKIHATEAALASPKGGDRKWLLSVRTLAVNAETAMRNRLHNWHHPAPGDAA